MGRTSETRERLLEAGCELFHRRGYQSVGVQELCDRAGVKKGSFYHFFRSKKELALATIERRWEEVRANDFEPAFRDDLPPLQRIQRFFAALSGDLGRARTQNGSLCGCPFSNLALEMSAQDETLREKLQGVFAEKTRFFETAIREAMARGDISLSDPRSAAESLVAFSSGIALLAKTQNDVGVAERLSARALAFVSREVGLESASR